MVVVHSIGKNMLSSHFIDYLRTTTSDNGVAGYTYKYLIAEDGYSEKEMTVNGDIWQKDVTRMFAPEFRMSLTCAYQDGKMIRTNGDFDFSTGCTSETDKIKLHKLLDNRAVGMLEDIIAGDQKIAENMKTGEGDYTEYKCDIDVLGTNVEANFNYNLYNNRKAGYQGLVNVYWSAYLQ